MSRKYTTQRAIWNGDPEKLSNAFRLTKFKGERVLTATCEVWSHQFGWELRLTIDGRGLQMSSVARTPAESTARIQEWRAAMFEKGWR